MGLQGEPGPYRLCRRGIRGPQDTTRDVSIELKNEQIILEYYFE